MVGQPVRDGIIPSAPAKILIGISLDPVDSNELLSWAISVLAQPTDTIVAIHVLADEKPRKLEKMKKTQSHIRQAKAHVISVLGEFARTCQPKQINLEARVGFSSSIAGGLIEEAKSISADYLVLRGLRSRSDRTWHEVIRYCFEHAPEGCTVVSFGKCELPRRKLDSDSASVTETNGSSSGWLSKKGDSNDGSDGAYSPVENHIKSETKRENSSPRTVLDELEAESHSAEDGYTVVSFGKCEQPRRKIDSDSGSVTETNRSSSRWLSKKGDSNDGSDRAYSPVENHIKSETKRENSSPRTVLDELEAESHSTEDDTFSFGDSSNTESSSLAPNFKGQSKTKKQLSTCKIISSFFTSPMRKRNDSFSNKEKKQQPLLKCFSYEEIANATNNFHPENIVGRGGYSEVYRGDLSDGRTIAVKMLAKDNKDPTKEKEFLMELGIIGHVCHPNTANLVGCCIENGLYLIFSFSQNGNLASALHGKTVEPIQWEVRYRIAIGVARGLHYLHKCCKHRIIHRDIKASNVLLGPDYEPQITDFGLAKWLPNKWTHHAVIPIEGTFGYLAPEYFMHGIVDEKTDVYSFGILLLEIITGRRPVDSSKQNLLLWAKPLMESGNITQLADPNLEGKFDADQMHRVVLTASYCVRQSPTWRPSMSEVLELLTTGQDSEVARSWRMPKFTSDELDDYSMVFGYDVPVDIALEDYL